MGRSSPRKPFSSEYIVYKIEFPLHSFGEYIKLTNSLISKEIEKANKRFNESELEINKNIRSADNQKLEGNERHEFIFGFYDSQAEQEFEIKNYYQEIFYSSIIMSLYSFLERRLLSFCQAYENDHSIKIREINGKGIHRSKIYIEKILAIKLQEVDLVWKQILRFGILRNLITHNEELRILASNRSQIDDLKKIL